MGRTSPNPLPLQTSYQVPLSHGFRIKDLDFILREMGTHSRIFNQVMEASISVSIDHLESKTEDGI